MSWNLKKAFKRNDYAGKTRTAKNADKQPDDIGKADEQPSRQDGARDGAAAGLTWQPAKIDRGGFSQGFSTEVLQAEQYDCAFCRGRGHTGIMKGQCPVCHGNGTVHMAPPAVRCAFCRGRGQVPPRSELTCCVCKGVGVVSVTAPVETCPSCRGRGRKRGEALYCGQCRGTGVITSPRLAHMEQDALLASKEVA